LKHDVDIPDNLGAGQTVGGGRVEMLQTGCVELFTVTAVLSEPAPGRPNRLAPVTEIVGALVAYERLHGSALL